MKMDKLTFDLKVAQGDFQFIPGNIEMSITQHPDVHIEYVGDPLYVPPSAAPNYKPLDVRLNALTFLSTEVIKMK